MRLIVGTTKKIRGENEVSKKVGTVVAQVAHAISFISGLNKRTYSTNKLTDLTQNYNVLVYLE